MKKILILLFLPLGFIFSQDLNTEEIKAGEKEKLKKQKYLRVPINLSRSSFDFSYGVEDKCEFTIDLDIDPDSHGDDYTIYPRTASLGYWTWSEEEQYWDHSYDYILYDRIYTHDWEYDHYLDLSLGIKKFFKIQEKEKYKRSLYVNSQINAHINSYKHTRTYSYSGWEDWVDPPDDPQDGDTYGDVWNSNELFLSETITEYINNYYGLNFSLGCRLDSKVQLFNIPNLFLSMDVKLLGVGVNYYDFQNISKIGEYNEDYYDDYLPVGMIDINKYTKFFLDAPSINVYFKYNL